MYVNRGSGGQVGTDVDAWLALLSVQLCHVLQVALDIAAVRWDAVRGAP